MSTKVVKKEKKEKKKGQGISFSTFH